MSIVICITGMHRSGTSLTASWLERCGLPIHAGSLISPAEGNVQGHFEDRDMVYLHNDILQGRGLGSVGWGLEGDRFLSFGHEERARAETLARQRLEKFPVWGWKDPRTVLFLDEWKGILPDIKVLLLWRPAVEVVDSLLRRSRRTRNPDMRARASASMRLWRAYNRLILDYKRRNEHTSVLAPVSGLVEGDGAWFALMERKFAFGLEYSPLGEVFNRDLLRTAGKSARQIALQGLAMAYGCPRLEQELEDASDDPSTDALPRTGDGR